MRLCLVFNVIVVIVASGSHSVLLDPLFGIPLVEGPSKPSCWSLFQFEGPSFPNLSHFEGPLSRPYTIHSSVEKATRLYSSVKDRDPILSPPRTAIARRGLSRKRSRRHAEHLAPAGCDSREGAG